MLYRYSPKVLHYAGDSNFTHSQPAWVSELTPAQQAVLEPAYIYDHPELDNDGALLGYEAAEQGEEARMMRRILPLSNSGEVPFVIETETGKFRPTVPARPAASSAPRHCKL